VSTNLFGEAERVPLSEALEYDDLRMIYLREKHDLPADWEWYELNAAPDQVPPGFIKVTGAVAPMMARAKRRDWKRMDRSTVRTFFIDNDDFKAWKRRREGNTGVCQECSGHGKVQAAFGVTGVAYRECNHCAGSGRRPLVTA
jgi:hypothetical protein